MREKNTLSVSREFKMTLQIQSYLQNLEVKVEARCQHWMECYAGRLHCVRRCMCVPASEELSVGHVNGLVMLKAFDCEDSTAYPSGSRQVDSTSVLSPVEISSWSQHVDLPNESAA